MMHCCECTGCPPGVHADGAHYCSQHNPNNEYAPSALEEVKKMTEEQKDDLKLLKKAVFRLTELVEKLEVKG